MSRLRNKLLLVGGVLLVLFILGIWPFYTFAHNELKISIVKTFFSFNAFKTVDSQVTILMLGIPGEPHDGPYLSDSILVINYDFKKNRVVTINIPRDIWSPTLEDKINSAYAYGEAKKKGGGLILAQAEVSAITGAPIPYSMVINFEGFKKLVDFLGGVDVEVERSFIDKKFPIAGRESMKCPGGEDDTSCRYETVTFKKGKIHMDGTTALKYVRSRNAEGAEGSDFARGKRQEKVIEAIKPKILSILFTLNVDKSRKLYELSTQIMTRNLTNQQLAILAKNMFLKGNFYSKGFSLPNDLFTVPPTYEYGRYVLIPRKGFDTLHAYIACLVAKEDEGKCK